MISLNLVVLLLLLLGWLNCSKRDCILCFHFYSIHITTKVLEVNTGVVIYLQFTNRWYRNYLQVDPGQIIPQIETVSASNCWGT